jgi:hypothetical protein
MADDRTKFSVGYGAVEAALVQSYRIPSKAVGAFRGRLGALQKQGLFGAKNMPGKGRALRYTPDMLHRIVFAIELAEFGIGPATVLSLVRLVWERRLRKIFEDAEDAKQHGPGPNDVIMYMGGVHLLGDALSNAVPNVNSCQLGKLRDHMDMWMSMTPDDPLGLPPRALVTNLTMRLRQFHNALAASYMNELKIEQSSGRRKK